MAGSLRITGGSLLLRAQRSPSGLRRCCQRLPFSEVFLLGARRASPVPVQPFLACCRHYPAGSGRGISQVAAAGVAFAKSREARHPGLGISRGLRGVRYLRPTRSLPGLSPGLSGGTAPGFRPRSVSSASWCWLFPCWGFHPLGHTVFTGHARSGHADFPHPAPQKHGFATRRKAECTTRARGNGNRSRSRRYRLHGM